MQRRGEEARQQMLIDELERMLAKPFSAEFRANYIRGADELTLVRSGLDDTMRAAYQSMRQVWHEEPAVKSLRAAAYLVGIRRIAASYAALGL